MSCRKQQQTSVNLPRRFWQVNFQQFVCRADAELMLSSHWSVSGTIVDRRHSNRLHLVANRLLSLASFFACTPEHCRFVFHDKNICFVRLYRSTNCDRLSTYIMTKSSWSYKHTWCSDRLTCFSQWKIQLKRFRINKLFIFKAQTMFLMKVTFLWRLIDIDIRYTDVWSFITPEEN